MWISARTKPKEKSFICQTSEVVYNGCSLGFYHMFILICYILSIFHVYLLVHLTDTSGTIVTTFRIINCKVQCIFICEQEIFNTCSCQHLFSSDLDFYYVAFSYIYAVEFFVYVCCKLSIIYIHVYADIGQNYLVNKAKMFYPSFYESVRQVMVFK